MLNYTSFLKLCGFFMIILVGGLLFLSSAIFARDYTEQTAVIHRVLPGETLSKIARRYFSLTEAHTIGDLIREIQEQNGLRGTLIRPEQRLWIPVVRTAPVVSKTIPKPRDFEARGIYINRFSIASPKMLRLVDMLIAHGGNTVIIDGKDMSGMISYPSRVRFAGEIGANAAPTVDDPGKLFHALHEKGLHISIRLVLFYDPLLAAKRPDLAIRSLDTGEPWLEGSKIAWVDPSHPTVQRYNLDLARELAEMGVDEIQFDYIRFPTTGNIRDAAYGFDRQRTPKHQVITDFLAQAREELASYEVLLSVDVFGVIGWGRAEDIEMTGQRIEDMARYADVISPMIYPSHFYGRFQGMANPGDEPFILVSETCKRFAARLLGTDVTLRPWVQAFPLGARRFGKEYILDELRAVAQSEARGWLLWSAGNAYDVAWKALAEWNHGPLRAESPEKRVSRLGDDFTE
jgi:hypothetical protein